MNHTSEPQRYPNDEIDLRELFDTFWRGKWIILLLVVVFASAGITYAFYHPNVYTASALLAPASDEDGVHLGGKLVGLASLAGVNIGGGVSNKTAIAKEVLQSRAFLGDFIRRHNLAVPLMATTAWDMHRQQWIIDVDIYNSDTDTWLTDDEGKTLMPTDWDLVHAFREKLSVTESQDNGMVTVSVTSLSPVAAKDWVKHLIEDLNDYMRNQEVAEAEASIEYLEGKLQETNIAGMQQVFYQLIESQTRTIMLASAQREYIFKTIDPAVVPQEKSGPRRAVIFGVATVVGGMLGMFFIFLQAFFRSNKERARE